VTTLDTAATQTFDVGGPIPLGVTTLIQASAGTGKTYTLSALCTRLVAEHGVPIDRILLVTFTRAATAELRGRVRRQLVDAEHHLAGPPCDPSDLVSPVLAALERSPAGGRCSAEERELRRSRLAAAISDFDAASISTIHGFCSQVRASIGVLAEHNTDAVPTQSEADLISQVCADLYFRALSTHDTNPFGKRSLKDLVQLVKKARTLTGAAVEAHSGLATDRAAAEMVRQAAQEVDDRLRRQGGQSFDSLLVSVRDALADQRLIGVLRDQYPVALIDEFQDTDPVQWAIFRTVFAEGVADGGALPRALFLVGDPKQAIYSFRGGDIYTYLAAKRDAETRALTTNHRSDASVLQAMNALAAGQTYQLWGQHGDDMISLGLLGSDPDVTAFSAGEGVSAIAISAEPSGGAQAPSDPLALGAIT
jgi:exodeoxyribonuclease V beta subunit